MGQPIYNYCNLYFKHMKNWELCPKCNGNGKTLTTISGCCDLCNGAKVISTYTGRPPIHTVTSNTTSITTKDCINIPFTYTKTN